MSVIQVLSSPSLSQTPASTDFGEHTQDSFRILLLSHSIECYPEANTLHDVATQFVTDIFASVITRHEKIVRASHCAECLPSSTRIQRQSLVRAFYYLWRLVLTGDLPESHLDVPHIDDITAMMAMPRVKDITAILAIT